MRLHIRAAGRVSPHLLLPLTISVLGYQVHHPVYRASRPGEADGWRGSVCLAGLGQASPCG